MMSPIGNCVCFLFVLAASGAAFAANSEAATQTELVKLTQELMDAIPTGKADVWQRILADDAMLVDEFGRRQNKADAVKSIHPFPAGFSGSIEIRTPELRERGDAAVLNGEFYERETVFGQNFVVRYIFSNTFVRRGGAWKLLATNSVTLPTAPPPLAVAGLRLDDYAGVYHYGPERSYTVVREGDALFFTTKSGGARTALDAVAKDVFMDGSDERNLLVFRRDSHGNVVELVERRKFNDLHMIRAVPH